MNSQHKELRHGPPELDNTLSQNVQNIQRSHEVYRQNYENLESGIDSRLKKLSWC